MNQECALMLAKLVEWSWRHNLDLQITREFTPDGYISYPKIRVAKDNKFYDFRCRGFEDDYDADFLRDELKHRAQSAAKTLLIEELKI